MKIDILQRFNQNQVANQKRINTVRFHNNFMIPQTQQKDSDDVYASVEEMIRMPSTRHLNPNHQTIFCIDKLSASQSSIDLSKIPDQIQENRDLLIKNVEKNCRIYSDVDFQFTFPESKFPPVNQGERNTISYEQKVIVEEEDTFRNKLSEEQLEQIAEKGEFQVKSSHENVKIPYVWKINGNIFFGKKTRINIWENGLAYGFDLVEKGIKSIVEEIPKQIQNIIYLPAKFFSLLVGRKKFTPIYTPDYHREIRKDFWRDVMENELKDKSEIIGEEFFNYMYIPYESKFDENFTSDMSSHQREIKQKQNEEFSKKQNEMYQKCQNINQVEIDFDKNWQKIRKRVLQKVSSEVETQPMDRSQESQESQLHLTNESQQDKLILRKFEEEKMKIYKAHLKEHLPKEKLSMKIIEALVQLITIISIIDANLKLKDEKLSEIKEKIRNKIKKEHTIRGRIYTFVNRKLEKEYDPIHKKIEEDFYIQLISDSKLSPWLGDKYQKVYQKYVGFRKQEKDLLQMKKKYIKPLYVPSRVFKSTYMLLPPYEVRFDSFYYTCVKSKEMYIDTSTDFWKFKLYAMRMKCWTINCLVSLIGLSWVGPFGLRCLFGIQEFSYDESCDVQTGLKYYQKRKPFLGVFRTVLSGIKKSRDHFQELPDRGLLGKNISRYFNYMECYIFRFLFVGVIGVLILYPIIIVVLSLLCIVLIVTFWAWVPLIMVICYIFNILVFQFQSSSIPRGILIRSIPLLSLFLLILRCVIIITAITLYGTILAPLIAVLYFVLLIIQRGFRTGLDCFMLFIFKRVGRTPSKDTMIARKISGPGMSRTYFSSINEEDVYILTQCFLQGQFLVKFSQFTRQKISKLKKEYDTLLRYVLTPFGHSSPCYRTYTHNYTTTTSDIVGQNSQALLKSFEAQLANHNNRYPRYPYRVRFTQEQIDQYFENSVKIVKNFVEKERIQKWIFDKHHLLHEDYEELTRVAWMRIFCCGEQIFEPLEEIDSRMTIEDMNVSNNSKMKKNVGSVMKALEGEVRLNRDRVKFTPAKRSLLSKDQQLYLLRQITQNYQRNSIRSVELSTEYPQSILFPHYNLKQLQKYDVYQREYAKKTHERVSQF